MKYEIEKIVTYCQALFEENKHDKKITFYTTYNNNVKLVIICKSYFYDIELNKEKLLKLKEKGLIQMSIQPIVNSLETFGMNFKLVFIINRHKFEKEKSTHSILRLINFIFDNIDILKEKETENKNKALYYYGYYYPPTSIQIVEKFSKEFVLYNMSQWNAEKIRYLTETESYYYNLYDYYENCDNFEKKKNVYIMDVLYRYMKYMNV